MATTRDYEHRLDNAATDLDHIRGVGLDGSTRSPLARARANLHTWAGHGAGRTGYTGSRSGGGHDLGDRVAAAVDAGRSLTSDEHAEALAQLDKQVIRVEHELQRLRKLVDAATLTVDPDTAARTTSMEECRLCAAVGSHAAVLALGLCDWCYRLARKLTPEPTANDPEPELVLPHSDLVTAHNSGKRVTINMIAAYHPIPTKADRIVDVAEAI